MTTTLSTGVPAIDDLIDGVRVGDNLVVRGRGGVGLDVVARNYAARRNGRSMVACTGGGSWPEPLADDITTIDLLQQHSPTGAADDQAILAGVRSAIRAIDQEVGPDSLFAFWTYTSLEQAWGPEMALQFFLWACPRLYRRGSVALWLLDVDQHAPGAQRRLVETTQVVVDLRRDESDDAVVAHVVKADGRPASTVGRRIRLRGDTLEAVGSPDRQSPPLGDLVREARVDRGMAQAELARRVGISPSALSQLERDVRSVSADTVTRIWEVLEVPFGPERANDAGRGYRLARRSAHPPAKSTGGLTRQQLVNDPDLAELWRVTVAPGASGAGALFATKRPELVTVLSGVVELQIDGHSETLHAGDGVTVTTGTVSGWSNPGSRSAELHWTIVGHGPGETPS